MKIKFWKVGCGDAITINFEDIDKINRNIFIDGGYLGTYLRTIKQKLLAIQSKSQFVDIWIITHTDRDHIGGVEAFLKDPTLPNKEHLVKEYWFNWSTYDFIPYSDKISVNQGITLRDYLFKTGKLKQIDISSDSQPIIWHNLKFTILSPDLDRLTNSKIAWQEKESDKLLGAGLSDYNNTIESLLKLPYEEDTDVWNGGSIAFLLEQNEKKILFLADSFPSVIIDALRQIGYSDTNKLHVDYIKLSHHGSKRNFNPALLEIVNCSRFIILANGVSHNLPNKWTLAQIITNPNRSNDKIEFYFNDDNDSLRSIFEVDNDKEQYNFTCYYNSSPYLLIDLG
ncbi:ComEC/Rec2 family competence protein [Adhaeribacter rhizoryzae]|uniref:MBL fold metallo-hydrolase n=1 Tax=Adhaeribacter rhizoryzae TaxID=2607907 RepID=A0A5M6D622_9BACT|nr:hypothetical protein [Adhaeribacter rhizoryzae]KAA5542948.1 hypothetical protein F0145_17565 [Adhaeribacter rhizoryzae]